VDVLNQSDPETVNGGIVWQKNSGLMKQAITFASTALGRPASECMFLGGLYGPPDPPIAQAYGMWLPLKLYSFCYWAFDQFCLNSRPVPLEIAGQMQVTGRGRLATANARSQSRARPRVPDGSDCAEPLPPCDPTGLGPPRRYAPAWSAGD
jgi:hypothetical protein